MNKVLVICGPTASGKTSLSVNLAKKLNTEIISADSMLIYKGMDIGTAKPTEDEKQGIIHHMIDVVTPDKNYSVSDYKEKALPIVNKLLSKDKVPIICGGTGFYIQSLIYESQFGNSGASEKVREKYDKILNENDPIYLHNILKQIDPETAEILHPNDTKRVIRALEIYETTGKKKSEQKDEKIPRFDFVAVSIDYPREELYERINIRVDKMFEMGLEEEINKLIKNGIDINCQSMQGIGYKEVVNNPGLSLDEIKELIKKNTRNYAKRQITFFKRMENHILLPPERASVEEVLKLL